MWIWLLAGGVVLVSLTAGGSAKIRRGPKVKVCSETTGGCPDGESGTITTGQIGSWICRKGASKIPIPSPGQILPAQLMQSNVILTAIEAMIGVVRAVFDAIGSWACVVLNGETVFLAQIRGPHVEIEVVAEVGWKTRPHAAYAWVFTSPDVSSTGELPVDEFIEVGATATSKSTAYNGDELAHLRDGARTPWGPPDSACPATCRASKGTSSPPVWIDLPKEMLTPRLWVLRTGEDIRLWLYIPPRSGHYNASGKRDDDIEWSIAYNVKAVK